MKICLLAHSFPPVVGGGETHVYLLAHELHKRGCDVTVITGVPTEYPVIIENYPFQVIRLQHFRGFEEGWITFREFLPSLKAALCVKKFDVVHIHNFMPALAYLVIASLVKTKIIFTFHSTPIPEEGKILGHFNDYELEKAFTGFILRHEFYSKLVCPSRYYWKWAIKLGAPKQKTIVVYHGIDWQRFQCPKDSLWRSANGYHDNDFVIVCAARMIPRKGILDLVKAMTLVNNTRIKLYIATSVKNGSEEYAEVIRHSIEELGLSDRIRLVFDQHTIFDIPQLLANCNAIVLPSHVEGFGIVLLEGMAAGLPVIGANTSGISEVIDDGKNGLLVEPRNPQDIADKLELLFQNPSLIDCLVKGGREIVKNRFSLSRQVDELLSIYKT